MTDGSSTRRLYLRIFLLSVCVLYLEVLLIRWISTEIRIFAYFKNLTLIACFFGLGLGCMLAGRKRSLWVLTFPGLLALVAVVILPERVGLDLSGLLTRKLGEFSEMPLWVFSAESSGGAGRWAAMLVLLLLFLFITLLFVPAGSLLGMWMDQAKHKITAYSVNIVGSLLGIGIFALASFLSQPPSVWFASVMLLGCLLAAPGRERLVSLACTASVALLFLLARPAQEHIIWTPYQKLAYTPVQLTAPDGSAIPAGFEVAVNETFHQRVADLRPSYLRSHPALFPEAAEIDYMGYNLPYRLQPRPERVLVVGAGTGNDVAAALRNGAGHVDAVEIDRRIVELGELLHPEQPYDDPNVTVHVNDARAFLKRTRRQYELIVFGALDSHTLSSSMSNIRIDNYVYTVEAFQEARNLLAPGGILVVVFAAERPFILKRLHGMLAQAFGHEPVNFRNRQVKLLAPTGGGPTLMIDREGRMDERIAADPAIHNAITPHRIVVPVDVPLASDDWPYLYLSHRRIPRLYLIVMGALVIMAAMLVRPSLGRLRSVDWHFFFLGAGFLLVEVAAISRLALLFGTTWNVNTIVLAAIMATILLANLVAARWPAIPLQWAYAGVILGLLLTWAWPLDTLLHLPSGLRGLAAGALVGLPIFFAGIAFIRTFAVSKASHIALGSNLLGAIVGGACESLSFVVGVRALSLIAVVFYIASLAVLAARGKLSSARQPASSWRRPLRAAE